MKQFVHSFQEFVNENLEPQQAPYKYAKVLQELGAAIDETDKFNESCTAEGTLLQVQRFDNLHDYMDFYANDEHLRVYASYLAEVKLIENSNPSPEANEVLTAYEAGLLPISALFEYGLFTGLFIEYSVDCDSKDLYEWSYSDKAGPDEVNLEDLELPPNFDLAAFAEAVAEHIDDGFHQMYLSEDTLQASIDEVTGQYSDEDEDDEEGSENDEGTDQD